MIKMHQLFLFVFFIGFCSCAKKKEREGKLGKDYFKLAMLELSDHRDTIFSKKKALKYLEKALICDPCSKYLAIKATVLFSLGNRKASLLCFQKALKTCKNHNLKTEILNNYACLLATTKSTDKALKIWRLLEHDTCYLTPEVALVNQGRVYASMGQLGKAKNCFQKAINYAPDFVDAHCYLALVSKRLRDDQTMNNALSTITFLHPHHFLVKQTVSHRDIKTAKEEYLYN